MTPSLPGPQAHSGGVAAPSRVEPQAGASANSAQQAQPLGEATSRGPLVSSAKSQTHGHFYQANGFGKADFFRPIGFEVNRNKLRIVRNSKGFTQVPPIKPPGAKINAFSARSQRKLREVAANADPELVSMFVCTYAEEWPRDGRAAKVQLNKFLTRLRKELPGVGYLWVLEFQRRGAPHFHIFLTKPKSDALHRFLAKAWHKIAGNGCEKHLRVHMHPFTFIDWDMGQGNYVAKYLDKANQKYVPEGYQDVGRFWGSSRGLVPDPVYIECMKMAAALMPVAPNSVKQATRWLAKWHEKHVNHHVQKSCEHCRMFRKRGATYVRCSVHKHHARCSSLARRTGTSYTLPTAAPLLKQILKYFERLTVDYFSTESPF